MLSILSALFPRYAAPRKGDCIGKRRYLSEKRRGPFQFIFFLRNFFYDFRRIRLPPPTASVSAPSRRLCAQPTGKLRQSTQPGGNGQNNPAAHRVSPPKKKMKILGALNDCAICRGSHFNILPMPKPNQTTENEMNNAIKATKTYGLPIPHQGKLQANPSKGCH